MALNDAKKKQEQMRKAAAEVCHCDLRIRAWVAYTGDQFDLADIG